MVTEIAKEKAASAASPAKHLAEYATRHLIPFRRGVINIQINGHRYQGASMEGMELVCIYNNNPYAAGKSYREKETAALRKKLKAMGVKELAYETAGEDGYTYAMILEADNVCAGCITDAMLETISPPATVATAA